MTPVCHVPYTWGSSWEKSIKDVEKEESCKPNYRRPLSSSSFMYIIASDILLYVRYSFIHLLYVLYH
jgi:hypothetical protein